MTKDKDSAVHGNNHTIPEDNDDQSSTLTEIPLAMDETKVLIEGKISLTQSQQEILVAYNKTLGAAKNDQAIDPESYFRNQINIDDKNAIKKAFQALKSVFGDTIIDKNNSVNIFSQLSVGQKLQGVAVQVGTCSRRRSTYQNYSDVNAIVELLDKEKIISEKLAKLRAGIKGAHLRIFGAYNEAIALLKSEPKTNFGTLENEFLQRLDGDKYKDVFVDCFRGLYATFGNSTISEQNCEKITQTINWNGKFFSSLYAAFTLNLGYSSWWNKDAFNKVLLLIERDIQKEEKIASQIITQVNKEEDFQSTIIRDRKDNFSTLNPFD